jgi:hypothetical protein
MSEEKTTALQMRIADLEAALKRMHNDNSRLMATLEDIAKDPESGPPLYLRRSVSEILRIARDAVKRECDGL